MKFVYSYGANTIFNKGSGIEEFCEKFCFEEPEVTAEVDGQIESEVLGGGPEDPAADLAGPTLVGLFEYGCEAACQSGFNTITDQIDSIGYSRDKLGPVIRHAFCDALI